MSGLARGGVVLKGSGSTRLSRRRLRRVPTTNDHGFHSRTIYLIGEREYVCVNKGGTMFRTHIRQSEDPESERPERGVISRGRFISLGPYFSREEMLVSQKEAAENRVEKWRKGLSRYNKIRLWFKLTWAKWRRGKK